MNKPAPSDALAAGERSPAATRPSNLAVACFAHPRPDRGLTGSKIVNTSGQGPVFEIVLGIAGGALFSLIGAAPVTGLNIYSLVGAIVVLWSYHAVVGRRSA